MNLPVTIGTPLSPGATRVLLLGSGELGKEGAIELQRFGAEVVAVDRCPDALAPYRFVESCGPRSPRSGCRAWSMP